MSLSSTDIIEQLGLEPLEQEGGFYRRTYQTSQSVDLDKGFSQPLGTAIYFLLSPETFSAIHWLDEDEVYHFYLGDPIELYEFIPGTGMKRTVLGQNLEAGHQVQYPVLKHRWHGSKLMEGGKWALLGTTMSPGFAWEDFKLGERHKLIRAFPEHQEIIESLTRT